jgi:Fe-Mn family superoxide dismutase
MAIPPGTYRLGPKDGTLSVNTTRTGAAAAAGHDLLIHVIGWEATLEVGDETAISLSADPTSLRVREGTGGMQPLGYEDKASIEQTIDEEILLRRGIEFRSTSVRETDGGLAVEGELELAGETRPVAFDVAVDGGAVRARVVVTQTTWGITPYTGLFGALKVADDLEVGLEATLPAERGGELHYEAHAARPLEPGLLELDGISRETVYAHYALYEGYVARRNAILERLAAVDLDAANQVSSELRALKVELSFAIGGIKNHELYFEHLGGHGGKPAGAAGRLIERDFGSGAAWRADLKAAGMAGRGWAWTAYDWDEGRLLNYVGDAQNTFPIWNATPLVALDVYEHAYVLDFGTDRDAYIDAFLANLDWSVVNDRVWKHQIPVPR